MLFGNADIEHTGREAAGEFVEAGSGRHGGGDADDLLILFGFGDQGLGENRGIGRRIGCTRRHFERDRIEFGDGVIFFPVGLGEGMPLALFCHHMDENRTELPGVAYILQDGNQRVDVMPVDRADIIETEFLEQRAAGQHAARIFICPMCRCAQGAREFHGELLGDTAQREERPRRDEPGKIIGEGADGRRDRHAVVV